MKHFMHASRILLLTCLPVSLMATRPTVSSVLFALGQKARTSNVGGVISKADLLDVIVVYCESEASSSSAPQRTREVVQRRLNRWLKVPQNSQKTAGYLHIVDAPVSVQYFGPDVVVEVLQHFGAVITDKSREDIVHTMQRSDSAEAEEMAHAIHLDPHPVPMPAPVMEPEETERGAYDDADSAAAAAAPSDTDAAAVVMFDPEFHPAPAGAAAAAAEGEAAEDNVHKRKKRRVRGNSDSVAALLDEYKQKYQHYSHDDLVREIMLHEKNCTQFREESLAKDGTRQNLQKKLKTAQQQLRRVAKAKTRAKAAPKGAASASTKRRAKGQRQQHESNITLPEYLRAKQKLEITRTGGGQDAPGRYLTVPSMVSLAVRRNLSNVSCADLGLVILDDASRWSVARSEVRAGAAATASMREWHAGMLQEMFHPDGAEDFNLSLHIVSQDATNSGIWQKRKLIALLCHSAYLVSLPSKFRWSWNDMFREIRAIADVQPVEDGSGRGSVSLTTKLLKSINCPTVHDLIAKHAKLKADRQQHQPADAKPADAKLLCLEWQLQA